MTLPPSFSTSSVAPLKASRSQTAFPCLAERHCRGRPLLTGKNHWRCRSRHPAFLGSSVAPLKASRSQKCWVPTTATPMVFPCKERASALPVRNHLHHRIIITMSQKRKLLPAALGLLSLASLTRSQKCWVPTTATPMVFPCKERASAAVTLSEARAGRQSHWRRWRPG
jgi:hypothetical protein